MEDAPLNPEDGAEDALLQADKGVEDATFEADLLAENRTDVGETAESAGGRRRAVRWRFQNGLGRATVSWTTGPKTA